ncbi:MAG: ACP S-malonyltransferase [Clostridiales bacterium]|nr:ACP S-malonyltransferase [Clostridiales bacterium]MDD7034680.1 ACP S-malonyltransferase [Bacillota bacterium]MDY2919691.1 ACP S-malonyltransferase [Lentihominibacter sp.]
MGKTAFIFAGQGAQKPGMGKDLYDNIPAAAQVFDRADKVREKTSWQCFEADEATLKETKNTQPCIYTMDYAVAEALREAGVKADMVAGYSLGELAALAFAGAFTFEEGLRLVSERGALMQTASEACETGMTAVLKLSDEKVEEICGRYNQVYPVNFNCDGQVSVAGVKDELGEFNQAVKAEGGLPRVLQVSGAFHSPFMAEAAEGFAGVLESAEISETEIPAYSNYTSKAYEGDYRDMLVKQISNPVRWKNEIRNMIEAGVDTFVEVGPGNALAKMVTRISKDVTVISVNSAESFREAVERIG